MSEAITQAAAYDLIDRFLRNNLYDDDYAKYSEALEALRTLAQQAQEPVANDRDCPHCNYTGSMHCGDVAKTHGGILNPKDCSHAKLFGSRRTLPPAPQPAPVDELIEALEDLMDWQVKNVKSWHNRAYDRAHFVIEKHRAALQSPAPQTKGQP